MSDACSKKKKAKQRWAIWKPKFDNARQLRGIFSIKPNDEEFKLTMKAARRKLEVPMWQCLEPHRNVGKRKTKNACVVDAETKARQRWTQTSSRSHHCKRDEFYNSQQSCSEFIPMPQTLKKLVQRQQWRKNGDWRKSQHRQLTKVRQEGVIDEARNDGRKVHIASLIDFCHFKKFGA